MSTDAERLNAMARECGVMLPAALPHELSKVRSSCTEAEYLRMAHVLLQRAQALPGGLAAAVQDTGSTRTFHKRMAALKFCCRHLVIQHLEGLCTAQNFDWERLADVLPRLHEQLSALITLKQQGMTQPKRKRRSKRQALRGLPSTWREDLCERGARGKYSDALLISALTGARLSELVTGIDTRLQYDESVGMETVCLYVTGAKVATHQGQPHRIVAYAVDDPHPLVAALVRRLCTEPGRKLYVKIVSAGNFTVEIQRLGRSLWREHAHALTATCFRHQWSADLKASGDADAASRGLGHRSAKTRRYYGTAHQARGGHALQPVRIEADLPVKARQSQTRPDVQAPRPE
ncbi:hypothetical protein [Massilia sp. CFBP9026]|uniref:hypothetical protein n=1 Tax=Massilia sp. CFBP9026 TaxID=3096536 RepID=UPI002A6AAA99|nr:hypothetical protein [Massilia sp. CFBP9026]MDY0965103.1 hypothetical protein [Massilia sp. CFBP9026]